MKFQFIVFLVIGLISLIRTMNQAKNQNQKPQANRGDAPPRRQKVQNEIEAFLTEVKSAANTAAPDQQQQQAERKRAQQLRRQQAQRARQARQQSRPAQAKTSQRSLGSGIGDHVASYISQHVEEYVDSKVDDKVEANIVRNVDRHLGNRSTEMPAATTASSGEQKVSSRFRELLKSREGIRQAILLNEILTRPRSLRK
jgi:Skp family chaperone for outer membrane proteins